MAKSFFAITLQQLLLNTESTNRFINEDASLMAILFFLLQFCLHLISKEVEFANNTIDFIDSFNITVETLEKFLSKKWAHHLDNLFYDFKSFTEFLLSEFSSFIW